MYMVVFVTLMVALIGAYTQIYTKQASKSMEQQSSAVNAMITWHSVAADLASRYVKPTPAASFPCTLTSLSGPPVPAYSFCLGSTNAFVDMPMGTECLGGVSPPCVTRLPDDYSSPPYRFYSIMFISAANKYFVLTYVPPPASGGYGLGLLCLPGSLSGGACPAGHAHFSFTFGSLYKQLINNKMISPTSYGTVTSAGILTTPTVNILATPQSLTYTIPAPVNAIVPVGSIGIISEISPCTSC